MSTQMSVFLSQDSAAPHWGEKALLHSLKPVRRFI